jgi:hypothetical protein
MTPESRIVGPEKASIARQRLGKNIPTATYMHAIEELLEAVTSMRPVPKLKE